MSETRCSRIGKSSWLGVETAADAVAVSSGMVIPAMGGWITLGLAGGEVPVKWFKPIGTALMAGAGASFVSQLCKKNWGRALSAKLAGIASALLAGEAVYQFMAIDQEAIPEYFLASVALGSAVMTGEMTYDFFKGKLKKIDVARFACSIGEQACLMATISQGGVGNIMVTIEKGEEITTGQKIAAYATTAFAAVNTGFGVYGAYNWCKSRFFSKESSYKELPPEEVKVVELSGAEKSKHDPVASDSMKINLLPKY